MIRNSFVLSRQGMLHSYKGLTARGGHGWDRPDVPLLVPYQHKRIISIFDVNIWFYCGVMPEYFINTNEAYLGNALGGIKQSILDFRILAAGLVVAWIVHDFMQFSRTYSVIPDAVNMHPYKYLNSIYTDRPMVKAKHFLNFKITSENGNLHFEPYTKSSSLAKYDHWIGQTKLNLQQNQEAKNYIEKVERNARVAVLNALHHE